MLVFSCIVVSDSFAMSWTAACQTPRSKGFPRQEYQDCHFLPQGIFSTQGLNPSLLHCRQTLYHWATREAHTDEHRNLAPSTQTFLASISSHPQILLFSYSPLYFLVRKYKVYHRKSFKSYIDQNAFALLVIISSRLTRKLNFKIVVFKYLLAIEFFDILEILYGSLLNHLK